LILLYRIESCQIIGIYQWLFHWSGILFAKKHITLIGLNGINAILLSLIREDTGWYPKIDLDETLKNVLDYWRAKVSREEAE
jgi:hypothetical protein